MEERVDYLPLGSVVIVHGGVKKYVIVARGLQLKINGDYKLFDYGACTYPEGMMGDRLMYFQASDINKVVFKGYTDDVERADVRRLKQSMRN